MRPLLALAVALVVVACRNSSEAPAQRGAAGSAGTAAGSGSAAPGSGSAASGSGSAVADPWNTQAAPKPPDTPETRKARAERALQRVATILPEVARLRGLTYNRTVPTKYQLPAEFQAFVRREIARE